MRWKGRWASCIRFNVRVVMAAIKILKVRNKKEEYSVLYFTSKSRPQKSGAPNVIFRENICSEGELRPRIFGTFVVKFLACLPGLLGFLNI